MAIEIYRGKVLVASFETRGGREFADFYGDDGAAVRALLEASPARPAASRAARVPTADLAEAGYHAVLQRARRRRPKELSGLRRVYPMEA